MRLMCADMCYAFVECAYRVVMAGLSFYSSSCWINTFNEVLIIG